MENGIHPLNGPENADSYQRFLIRNIKQAAYNLTKEKS